MVLHGHGWCDYPGKQLQHYLWLVFGVVVVIQWLHSVNSTH